MSEPLVSVLIATYTRAPLLDECLQHLARAGFLPGDEVIVIDNGSTDDTSALVQRHQRTFPVPLHLLYEAAPGKSRALACGLAQARGEVLAFLDDDVNVDARWLDVVRRVMSDPGTALMGGRVLPRWAPGVPQWMRYAPARHPRLGAPLALLDYPPGVVELGPRTVLGANMALRREVIDVLGGFAPHLGKLRGTLLSGEDDELCKRVQRAGFRAVYVPEAVVHHWVPAERARVGYFLQWFYWSGITNAIMDADRPPPARGRTLRGLPLHFVKRGVLAAVGVAAALLRGRRDTALDSSLDIAFAAGYAAERWGLSARSGETPAAATREAA